MKYFWDSPHVDPDHVLSCPVCKRTDFIKYKLRVHVENSKGTANLNQYKCTYCNFLMFFNMPLTAKEEE